MRHALLATTMPPVNRRHRRHRYHPPPSARALALALLPALLLLLTSPRGALATPFALARGVSPSLPALRAPARRLLRRVAALERLLVSAAADDAPSLPTCNQRDEDPWPWRNALESYFKARGWEELDLGCISDTLSSSVHARHARGLFADVTAFSRALAADAPAFVAPVRAQLPYNLSKLWPHATRHSVSESDLGNQRCLYDFAFFAKRGGAWYVSASVTNLNPALTVPQGRRSFIGAYVDERLHSLPMNLTQLPPQSGSVPARGFVSLVAGAAGGAELLPTTARQNAAVQLAISRGAHAVERASDALTVSNSAILMLPLVFNVIPVALIAEVNTLGMLVYTLLTDVLTAVPLLVKGVEVVVIGGQNTYAAVSRMTGANLRVDAGDNKAAELFVARCSPQRSFRSVGVALIIVALLFMVGGVLAEFAAMAWRRRRTKPHASAQPVDDKHNATYLWVTKASGGSGGSGGVGAKGE